MERGGNVEGMTIVNARFRKERDKRDREGTHCKRRVGTWDKRLKEPAGSSTEQLAAKTS